MASSTPVEEIPPDPRPTPLFRCKYRPQAFTSQPNKSRHERTTCPSQPNKSRHERTTCPSQPNKSRHERTTCPSQPNKSRHERTTCPSQPNKSRHERTTCPSRPKPAEDPDKQFSCSTCSKAFGRNDSLKRHAATGKCTVFKEPALLPCDICQKTFPSPSKVRRHKSQVHEKEPYTCLICTKTFRSEHHLSEHHSALHTVQPEKKRKRAITEKAHTPTTTDLEIPVMIPATVPVVPVMAPREDGQSIHIMTTRFKN